MPNDETEVFDPEQNPPRPVHAGELGAYSGCYIVTTREGDEEDVTGLNRIVGFAVSEDGLVIVQTSVEDSPSAVELTYTPDTIVHVYVPQSRVR